MEQDGPNQVTAARTGQPGNVYGHNGGYNGGHNGGFNRGNAAKLAAYQKPQQQQQHYQGYAAVSTGGNGMTPGYNMSMYPQHKSNTAYSHQPVPNQHQLHNAFPTAHAATYQSPVPQGQAYSGTMGTPTPTHGRNDMTPKYATPGSQLDTPHAAGPFTQTEPRNFAPGVHANPFVAPPPFMLQGASPVGGTRGVASGSNDPFLSSPQNKERVVIASSSRIILPPVQEADENPLPAAPVPAEIRTLRSQHLNILTSGSLGLPTAEVALNPANFPFIESSTQCVLFSYGVVKIKNIPFATRRQDIIAFFGRSSRVLDDHHEPVHIIMERVTSKTLDAYVEFMTLADAMKAVERHANALSRGRPARLGDRPVEVELSSQSHLMQDLFPLGSGVMWMGADPQILAPVDGQPWTHFKGFITEEEMTMLLKHVEIPHRSPFSKDCPQRPFECMISTIRKMPWHRSDLITVRQRWAVYNVTFNLLEHVRVTIQRPKSAVQAANINIQLQKRLLHAALMCPGFSVTQKDNLALLMEMPDALQRGFNQPRFADLWIHQQTVCPKPGFPIDLLEWYIAVIREETTRHVNRMEIIKRSGIESVAHGLTSRYFGYLWHEIGFPSGVEFDQMTLHQAAALELSAMERVLRRALPKTN